MVFAIAGNTTNEYVVIGTKSILCFNTLTDLDAASAA